MVSNMSRFIILVAILVCAGFTVSLAQTTVGTLTIEKGQVKIWRNAKSQIYRQQTDPIPLFERDVLHSGNKSFAIIRFGDREEQIRLYPKTHFAMRRLSKTRMNLGLTFGKIFVFLIAKLRTNRVAIQTSTAVIGVKGTEFISGSDGDATFLLTIDGTVSFRSRFLEEVEQAVRASEASLSTLFRSPTVPIVVTPAQRDQIVAGPGLETFKEVQFDDSREKRLQEGIDSLDEVNDLVDDLTSGSGGAATVRILIQ